MTRWPTTRLKFVAAVPITNGLGEAAQDGQAEWPRYIRTTDIATARSLNDDKRVTLPPELARKATVERDDLLMCAAGSLGKIYLHTTDEVACYAGYLVRFRPDLSVVDPRFVAYWAESQPFLDQIAVGAVRSTIDNFSAGKYQSMSLPLPPLVEQRRIADFLDHQVALLDRTVQLRQQQAALMAERHAAAADEALRPPGMRPAAVPARRLIDDIAVGIVVQPAALYTEEEDGVPAVRGSDISPGAISTTGLVRLTRAGHEANTRSWLRPTDVLVVRSGRAGAAARVPDSLVGANCVDVVIVRPGRDLDPGYLEHSINCQAARGTILEHSTGAIQSHFGVAEMKALPIVARDLADQIRVRSRLDEMVMEDRKITGLLKTSLFLLTERRRALVTAAVSGKFDVWAASGRGVMV